MTESQPNSDWNPCPAGALAGLASSMRRRRQQVLIRRTMLVSTFALILVAGLAYGLREGKPPLPDVGPKGGISCRDCVNKYDDYAAGRLDEVMELRMSTHLDACPSCKQHLEPNGGRKSTRIHGPNVNHLSVVAARR